MLLRTVILCSICDRWQLLCSAASCTVASLLKLTYMTQPLHIDLSSGCHPCLLLSAKRACVYCCGVQVTEEALDPSVVNPEAALQPQQPAQPAIAIPDAPAGHHIHTAAGSHHQQDTSSNIPSSGAPLCVSAGAAGAAGTPATLARQGERVSLTIRRVLRVHKALGIFKR